MAQIELIERIASETLRKGERLSTVQKHMKEGVELFEEWGITRPTDSDYKRLEAYYEALGIKRSAKDKRRRTKRYFDYVNGARQLTIQGIQPDFEQEDTMTEDLKAVEGAVEAIDDRLPVVEREFEREPEKELAQEMSDVSTEGRDREPLSPVDTLNHRRGRKPKSESDRRNVKLSIYLTREVFEGVRDIAAMQRRDVSLVIFDALNELVERNASKLSAFQDFLNSLGIK